MSTRLYVGNLPQSFNQKELEELFAAVGAGVRFKAVLDRDTGACRGFGFVNVDDAKLTDAVFEIDLIVPIAMETTQKFAIREGGRTIGAGRVTEIIE